LCRRWTWPPAATTAATVSPLPAVATWSPDGRYALFSDTPGLDISQVWRAHNTLLLDDDAIYTSANLHLGMMDAFLTEPGVGVQELPAVGQGFAPFWIDGRTFGYVAPDGRALLSATVDDPAPTTLLSAERALEALPGAVNPAQYRIRFALADPQDTRRLFVVVREGQPRGRLATVLAFDRQTGAVEAVAEAGFRQGFGLGLGPNGRFLVIAGANTPEPRAEANHLLLVNDLATGDARAFLTVSSSNVWQDAYAWSRDGRWLAIALDDATLGCSRRSTPICSCLRPQRVHATRWPGLMMIDFAGLAALIRPQAEARALDLATPAGALGLLLAPHVAHVTLRAPARRDSAPAPGAGSGPRHRSQDQPGNGRQPRPPLPRRPLRPGNLLRRGALPARGPVSGGGRQGVKAGRPFAPRRLQRARQPPARQKGPRATRSGPLRQRLPAPARPAPAALPEPGRLGRGAARGRFCRAAGGNAAASG
jgi:hypothetical protein